MLEDKKYKSTLVICFLLQSIPNSGRLTWKFLNFFLTSGSKYELITSCFTFCIYLLIVIKVTHNFPRPTVTTFSYNTIAIFSRQEEYAVNGNFSQPTVYFDDIVLISYLLRAFNNYFFYLVYPSFIY